MTTKSASTDRFRPDIEGLRAIAVLLVVASHAEVPGVAGGFVGVDVFFVISGYLITRLLLTEQARTGSISLRDFYSRRFRRLTPAFILMLAAVLLAIHFLYSPMEREQMLSPVLAATFYASNLLYGLGATSYMAAPTKLDPVLHTWSLGVEEQFYLAWPLLLLVLAALAARLRLSHTKVLATGLLLTGALSFLLCVGLTPRQQPMAFFLPLTRAWEFGLGALLVLLESSRQTPRLRHRGASWLAFAGLLLIAVPAGLFDGQTSFPGYNAAFPAVGTALLILALPAASGRQPVRHLLTLPVMQWLGRMSYGWYLWHWPLLVIGRQALGSGDLVLDLGLAAAGLVLAAASFHFVEQPARHGTLLRPMLMPYLLAAVTILVSTSAIRLIAASAQTAAQTPTSIRFAAAARDRAPYYDLRCDEWYRGDRLIECKAGAANGERIVVLFGDSHAGQWYSALNQLATQAGWRMVLMTKSACPVVDSPFVYAPIGREFTECARWRDRAIRRIGEIRPQLVIISSAEGYALSPDEWRKGTLKAVARLASRAREVVIIRSPPRPGFHVPSCLARQEQGSQLARRDCSFDTAKANLPYILAAQREAAGEHPNVRVVDMSRYICPGAVCSTVAGNMVKYRDEHHLTETFVRRLASPLRHELWPATPAQSHTASRKSP